MIHDGFILSTRLNGCKQITKVLVPVVFHIFTLNLFKYTMLELLTCSFSEYNRLYLFSWQLKYN